MMISLNSFRLKLAFSVLTLGAFLVLSGPVSAAEGVTISDAYAFAVPDTAKNAAAFMTLTYPTGADVVPDRIIRAESDIADQTQIHTMVIEADVMTMRAVDSFPLPPTGKFSLSPHGVHVMFLGLNRKLAKGDEFPLTLVFEKAGAVKTTVSVRAAGDVPAAADDGAVAEPAEEKAVHEETPDHMHHH